MAIPVRFVALIIALFGGLAAHAQKPITIQARAIDGLRAPARVAEMVAQADAVVIATATGRVRLAAMKREEDGLRSVHSFDVAEALKFNAGVPAAGDVLELELPGGEREYATHVLRETVDGEEPVRAGRRYLIFVNWIQGRDEIRRVPAWPMEASTTSVARRCVRSA